MLCPQCGVDVGGEVRLCDQCAAAKAAREKPPESASASTASSASDQPPAPYETESERPSAGRVVLKKIGGALIAGLILIGLAVVKAGIRFGVNEVVDGVSSSSGSSGDAQVAPSAAPLASSGGVIEERPPLVSSQKAAARINGPEVKFASSIARYTRGKRLLEVAYYRESLASVDHDTVAGASSLLQAAGVRPDLLVAIAFRPGTSQCDPQAVSEYRVTAFKNTGGFTLPADSIAFEVKSATGTKQGGPEAHPLLDLLKCSFEDGAAANLTLRGSKSAFVKDDSLMLSWDLGFAGGLLMAPPPNAASYNSKTAVSSVAMWDAEKRELNIGFFGAKVSARAREILREKKSLTALPDNQPDAVVTFSVSKAAHELQPSELKTFGVQLYRGRSAQLDFPGSEDAIGAFYVGGAQNSGTLEGLAGGLSEGERVSGTYKHSFRKSVNGTDVALDWQLHWYSVVLDLSIPPKTILGEGPEDLDVNPDELATGPSLSVSADQVTVDGKSAVGLYYPETGDVAVGVFSEELTDPEKQEIAQRGTLSSFVNHKRPVMVVYFDFPPGQSAASYEQLDGVTVYFYRGNGSAFQFAGNSDAVSLKRNRSQLSRAEIRALSGSLAPGGKLHIEMTGKGSSTVNPTKFAWRLSQDVPILAR